MKNKYINITTQILSVISIFMAIIIIYTGLMYKKCYEINTINYIKIKDTALYEKIMENAEIKKIVELEKQKKCNVPIIVIGVIILILQMNLIALLVYGNMNKEEQNEEKEVINLDENEDENDDTF